MGKFGSLLIAGNFSVGNFVFAQKTLDLKAPVGNEALGGEQKGTVLIFPKEHSVNIVANMTAPPKEGTVFERWLADVGGPDFKLSVGEFSKNGILDYTATMVNPYA